MQWPRLTAAALVLFTRHSWHQGMTNCKDACCPVGPSRRVSRQRLSAHLHVNRQKVIRHGYLLRRPASRLLAPHRLRGMQLRVLVQASPPFYSACYNAIG
ncbi:hypothetical protein DFS34DRAFT_389276 [Phlyctochytrium arcticum]|nr:hypothetical protein DFS34DRAFT_389276 [Phlyctochytrium arcticum]